MKKYADTIRDFDSIYFARVIREMFKALIDEDLDKFEELPNLYNCLDLYLISSRDEGGPTGLGEAMACGVPIISTKVGLACDFISNDENGYLTDLDDYQSIAKYIQKLYEDPKLCEKFSKNSIEIISNHFKDQHIHLWKSFFNDLKFKNL